MGKTVEEDRKYLIGYFLSGIYRFDDKEIREVSNLSISSINVARNLVRLLQEDQTDNLVLARVYVPTKHHQDWEDSGLFHIVSSKNTSRLQYVADKPVVFYDNLFVYAEKTNDPYLYLYQHCKDNGIEYKGPKR